MREAPCHLQEHSFYCLWPACTDWHLDRVQQELHCTWHRCTLCTCVQTMHCIASHNKHINTAREEGGLRAGAAARRMKLSAKDLPGRTKQQPMSGPHHACTRG